MEQSELLRHVVDILEGQGVTYLLVGSLASGVYGEPRLTHDIDVVVELRADQVGRLCEAFPAPEYYVSQAAAREAVATGCQYSFSVFGGTVCGGQRRIRSGSGGFRWRSW